MKKKVFLRNNLQNKDILHQSAIPQNKNLNLISIHSTLTNPGNYPSDNTLYCYYYDTDCTYIYAHLGQLRQSKLYFPLFFNFIYFFFHVGSCLYWWPYSLVCIQSTKYIHEWNQLNWSNRKTKNLRGKIIWKTYTPLPLLNMKNTKYPLHTKRNPFWYMCYRYYFHFYSYFFCSFFFIRKKSP